MHKLLSYNWLGLVMLSVRLVLAWHADGHIRSTAIVVDYVRSAVQDRSRLRLPLSGSTPVRYNSLDPWTLLCHKVTTLASGIRHARVTIR